MKLKNYIQFIKESSDYDYGCVMIEIPIENWNKITDNIDDQDLYIDDNDPTYGKVKNPHLTLLYGIHSNVSLDEINSKLENLEIPNEIKINGINIFENENFDVVKLDVENNDELQNIFDSLSELPNSNEFPDFKPHISIAYVKNGLGKKYIDIDYQSIIKIDNIVYSDTNDNKHIINIHKSHNISENKLYYKTINQFLDWLNSKSKIPFAWLDTETTGLGGPKAQQLTQISAILTNYNFDSNTFEEISSFDEKIKLTDEIKNRYNQPNDDSRKILSFNHYGSGNYKYKNEEDVVDSFFNWLNNYSPNLLIAQNAIFDMSMLGGRFNHKISNEVFDTKMLIQLYYIPLLQKLAESDVTYQKMISEIGTSPRDYGLISSSMSKIGPALGINMSGYHDALTDCRITIQMFQKIIAFLKQYRNVDIMKYQQERIKTHK